MKRVKRNCSTAELSKTGFSEFKKHLENNAIPYEEKITPDNKISQIFIKDPNGIKIELSKSL